jgi:N6-adenosine-specific RNA methylase IME4
MNTGDIQALEIPSAENSMLFLWTTNAHLPNALDTMKKWGFKYISNFVWVKDKIGLGYYMRGKHELLLLGKKGEMPPPEDHNRYPSVIQAQRTEHSAKPNIVYLMIEHMYPNRKYLELFSRNTRENWKMWGHEAEG